MDLSDVDDSVAVRSSAEELTNAIHPLAPDHQVKVRGFRIELGEIETVLAQHPAVHQACVIVRDEDSGDSRLVGYVVPQAEEQLNHAELKTYLRQSLPEYMIPGAFVTLDALPLTSGETKGSETLV